MGFVHRASSTRQYEKRWNYRAFFVAEFKMYEVTFDNYGVSPFFP